MSLKTVLVKQEPEWEDNDDLECGIVGHIKKPEFNVEVKVEPCDSVMASLYADQACKDKIMLTPVDQSHDSNQPVMEKPDLVPAIKDCFVHLVRVRLHKTRTSCTLVPLSNMDRDTHQSRAANHTETTSKQQPTNSTNQHYVCDNCGKIFTLKCKLIKHVQIHMHTYKASGNSNTFKQHTCELCGQNFKQRSHLYRHKRIHTGKKYSCKICNKTYTRLDNLREHKWVHARQKPYSCKICNKEFNQQRSLKMHVKIHSGEKSYFQRYLCEICNKEFTRLDNIKRHLRSHTGEMPYSCEICNRRFSRLSNLNEHVDVHSGKKHRCTVCGQHFTRLRTLKMHEKKYHM